MHVVHTESTKGISGQSLRLINEARALGELPGWKCTVIGPEGSAFHRRAEGEIDFVPFAARRLVYHPSNLLRAKALLSGLQPDIVHTHASRDAWIFGLAARRLRLPIVRGRHLTTPPGGRLKFPGSSYFGNYVYTHLADAFTVSGRSVGDSLLSAGAARREDIYLTPAGLDLARFDWRKREPDYLRRELGLGAGARLVGTACNLRQAKGVDVLVQAFVRHLERLPEADDHLVVAGAGDPTELLALAGSAADRVHFLGFRQDVELVLGGLDLMVLASRSDEGIPAVVPQAMAMRVPALASRAGGIADAIQEGETGFLVEPGDPEALSRRLTEVLALDGAERQALVEKACEHAVREYPLKRVVEEYVRVYERVLGQHRAASPH